MAGFKNTETIEQALDKGAPIGAVAEHFGLSRAEVTECLRRRDNARKVKALRRAALDQRKKRKEEAMKFFWQNKLPKGPDLREGAPIWAIDEQATTRAIDEYIGWGRTEVTEWLRRRRIVRWNDEIAKGRGAQVDSEAHRIALYQRMKEEAIEANWGNAPVIKAHQEQYQKWLGSLDEIVINGKNYTRLLDHAMRIVRARIEIVAAIGK